MIECRPEALALVRDILGCHVPDAVVRAFGSRVTGGARPWSDLDLVVRAETRLPFIHLARLREAFEASDLPFRVDVIDWHAISEGFRQVITRASELVQPSTRGAARDQQAP
ncbi:MAG: nucleotidyltransferase domain-containing protein [Deltaproteobacteria bacterium]|nr:nucleotidyltransferase domain-containing protein [Deltaproteobacteria bacterium]